MQCALLKGYHMSSHLHIGDLWLEFWKEIGSQALKKEQICECWWICYRECWGWPGSCSHTSIPTQHCPTSTHCSATSTLTALHQSEHCYHCQPPLARLLTWLVCPPSASSPDWAVQVRPSGLWHHRPNVSPPPPSLTPQLLSFAQERSSSQI